jgi:flavorubredoxin
MTISRPETQTAIDVSAYAPEKPPVHHEPLKVAEDTYLIRSTFNEGKAPMFAYVNSMVITGKQPVIVDTGTVANREDWLNDVFSLVDPKDVRWLFISHDDHDHIGNLPEALALCPNATLVSSWFQCERLAGDLSLPIDRMIWVDDGGTFDAGDRVFAAIRPPLFDSPTTRGLYDPKTGVYWGADSFAAPVAGPMDDVSGFHPEEWLQGFAMFNIGNSPWMEMVDAVKFNKSVQRVASLHPRVIAAGHTPAILGPYVTSALDMTFNLPGQQAPAFPGQAELDAIRAQLIRD